MRNLLPVCAGLVVISGISSAYLWKELREERLLNAELRTQLAAAPWRQPDPVPLRRNDAVPPPVAVAAVAKPSSNQADAKPAIAVPVDAPPISARPPSEAELLKNADYRKARLAQLRMSLPRNFPGLVEELGLSEKEADALFDLLADNQLNANVANMGLRIAAQGDVQGRQEEIRRLVEENGRKQQESVSALLGGARYAQWQEYQQTRSARGRATSLGSVLAAAGQPVSSAQLRPLIAAVYAEEQRQQQQPQTIARERARDPQAQAQFQEEAMKRQEEGNRRILEAAAPHLTAQQGAALRASFEEQAAMNRASNRVMQEQVRARAAAQAAGN